MRWLLGLGLLLRGLRALARAFLDAERSQRRLAREMRRLEATLEQHHREEQAQAALKMSGPIDTVEPVNIEGWMQMHAKQLGWDGRIVAPPDEPT